MALLKFNEIGSHYQSIFGNNPIQSFSLYSETKGKIGNIVDALVDDAGHFKYLVADLNQFNQRRVLVPATQAKIDPSVQRVYLSGISVNQIADLPTYPAPEVINRNEGQTSFVDHPTAKTTPMISSEGVVRPTIGVNTATPLENSVPLEASAPLEGWAVAPVASTQPIVERPIAPIPTSPTRNISTSHNSVVPMVNETADRREVDRIVPTEQRASSGIGSIGTPMASGQVVDEETIQLLEERLVVNRGNRRKLGEIAVRKEIETRMVQVPVRYEKLIVEQVEPEYKRLAVVDLEPQDHPDLTFNATPTSGSNLQPQVVGEFTSASAASRFLDAVAQSPNANYQKVEVRVLLRDAEHQRMYQQWVEQYQG